MKLIKKIVVFLLLLSAADFYAQQKLTLEAVVDSAKMRIGEQAKVDIYVTYNSKENIKIEWPKIGDTLTGKIEVVSVSPIDTTFPDKTNSTKIFQHQQILVSVYDSGYYAMPGFKFIINGDTANPQFTNPLFLEVHTVPTDTSATKLKDIKQPFDEKFNWKWYLNHIYFGVGVLVLIIIIGFIIRYYRRKNNQVILEPEKPKIPPHITALAALEKIRQEQIWREGKTKEYYSSISEAIRAYIEDRFNVNALESTTDEIMKAFRSQVVDKESKDKLQQLLTLSDLVKFAKMFPIEEEHNFTLQNAFDFVNATKREEEVPYVEESVAPANPEELKTPAPVNEFKADDTNMYAPGFKSMAPVKEEPKSEKAAVLEENTLKEEEKVKSKKRFKKIAIIVACILAAVLLFFAVMKIFFSSPAETLLETASTNINKMCPVMVDRETRLDNVTIVGDNVMQFNYTLVNLSADQIDVNAAKMEIEPVVLNQVRTNPQMESLRAIKATIKYSYNDKAGKFLFSIKVTPEDYGTYN